MKLTLFAFFAAIIGLANSVPSVAFATSLEDLNVTATHGSISIDIECTRNLTTGQITPEVSAVDFYVPENIDVPEDRIQFYSGQLAVNNDPARSTAQLHFSVKNGLLYVSTGAEPQGRVLGSLVSKATRQPMDAVTICRRELDGLVSYVQEELSPHITPHEQKRLKQELTYFTKQMPSFSSQAYVRQSETSPVKVERYLGRNLQMQDMLGVSCKRDAERDYTIGSSPALSFTIKGWMIWDCSHSWF